jgi:hypothetical protein
VAVLAAREVALVHGLGEGLGERADGVEGESTALPQRSQVAAEGLGPVLCHRQFTEARGLSSLPFSSSSFLSTFLSTNLCLNLYLIESAQTSGRNTASDSKS